MMYVVQCINVLMYLVKIMRKTIKKLIKFIIVVLLTLSLYDTLYEYDDYRRQYNTAEFMYKEGIGPDSYSAEEVYLIRTHLYSALMDTFRFILCLNLIITILIIIYSTLKNV